MGSQSGSTQISARKINEPRSRRGTLALTLAVLLASIVGLSSASSGAAGSRPTCFGKPATIVGGNGNNRISGTARNDVIVALGGNDVIAASGHKRNHGRDVVCGGGGRDKIIGDNDAEVLIGGPGRDTIKAGNGHDLVIGDNANRRGAESGPTSSDDLAGSGARDIVVGDNYASGDVTQAHRDKRVIGGGGRDLLVGDDASLTGDATGGRDDHLEGASGDDVVIGDSYAPHGTARGGGDDENNSGPGSDLAVGDSYTRTGRAIGGGNDKIHAADGGDPGAKCKRDSCGDVFYGDSYSAACGAAHTRKAILCQARETSGGGFDLLTSDQGSDFMNGGLPNNAKARGKHRDRCSGGSGRDFATQCELRRSVQVRLPNP